MPFIIEGAPARIISCEMHNKQAKKGDADMGKAPSREKKLVVEMDLSHEDFMPVLDERFPGVDLFTKEMAGKESDAMQLVAQRALGEIVVEAVAIDGKTPVFKIDVAKTKGKPTLRIAKKAEKILMTCVFVGSLPKTTLHLIDDYLGADIVMRIAEVQQEFDFASGDEKKSKAKKGKGGKGKTTLALVESESKPEQASLV
jgi:hypothetical protein